MARAPVRTPARRAVAEAAAHPAAADHPPTKITGPLAAEYAVNTLPDKMRIGPYVWSIEKWDMAQSSSELSGVCVPLELRIGILKRAASARVQLDTMLHEISHAIWFAYGIKPDDDEERTVSILGTAWTQVYVDNAWLAPWIAKCLELP